MRQSASLLVSLSLATLALGCGGSDSSYANDPSQQGGQYGGQYQQGGQYPAGQYGGQPQGQYPQQPGQPAPTQPTQPTAGTPPAQGSAGGAATPIAAAAMATPLLLPLQQQEAPGMQAEGQAFAGQFQEGQTLEQPLTLQPGKCYTVVAIGAGIQELDAMIAAQPLPQLPPTPLAQDNASGAQATVGGKGSCFRNAAPLAVPAKVIIKATRGAGSAVAQVYVK
jgi:hypothetical protein